MLIDVQIVHRSFPSLYIIGICRPLTHFFSPLIPSLFFSFFFVFLFVFSIFLTPRLNYSALLVVHYNFISQPWWSFVDRFKYDLYIVCEAVNCRKQKKEEFLTKSINQRGNERQWKESRLGCVRLPQSRAELGRGVDSTATDKFELEAETES